jgi:hypothetical protein
VNPGEPFGPSGRDFVRLSYAVDDGRLREGLRRLIEFVRDIRKEPERPADEPVATTADSEQPTPAPEPALVEG